MTRLPAPRPLPLLCANGCVTSLECCDASEGVAPACLCRAYKDMARRPSYAKRQSFTLAWGAGRGGAAHCDLHRSNARANNLWHVVGIPSPCDTLTHVTTNINCDTVRPTLHIIYRSTGRAIHHFSYSTMDWYTAIDTLRCNSAETSLFRPKDTTANKNRRTKTSCGSSAPSLQGPTRQTDCHERQRHPNAPPLRMPLSLC